MSEPAKVHKVPNDQYSVVYPVMRKFNLSQEPIFDQRSVMFQQFGKSLSVSHIDYHEMATEMLDLDYSEFLNGLVENCKTLFVTDPVYSHHYDALTHTDTIAWTVRVGSPELDYFKNLFTGPPEIREVEVEVYPQTLRECFKQMWVIIKKRFKHE